MKLISSILEPVFFICFGGIGYYFLEILFRGESHYSMMLCGGFAFYLVSLLNRSLENRFWIITRMMLSALLITFLEFCFGYYYNLFLHQQVWDYSTHLFHYQGQVCLTFSILWFFLSYPLFCLERFFRFHLFSSSDPS